AFLLFNGGIIALIRPIPIVRPILIFDLPVAAVTVIVIALLMWRKAIPKGPVASSSCSMRCS
ncbi:MAG TPA: hypothetical protein VJR05_13865, partial [Acidimicrobiia bacterium]|nr:hypothetical protein [Acidimicrobiia bacterium]